MSKYIDDLQKQLEGKNILDFTKQLKAEQNLSKILKDQKEKERQKEIQKEIQKMLSRY